MSAPLIAALGACVQCASTCLLDLVRFHLYVDSRAYWATGAPACVLCSPGLFSTGTGAFEENETSDFGGSGGGVGESRGRMRPMETID
jgi:hypothetical protein